MVYGSVAGEVMLWWGHSCACSCPPFLSVLYQHSGSLAPSCYASEGGLFPSCNPNVMTPSGDQAGTYDHWFDPSSLGPTSGMSVGRRG